RSDDNPQRVAAEQPLLIKRIERQQAAGYDLMIEIWQSIQLALRFETAHRDAFKPIIACFQCGKEFLLQYVSASDEADFTDAGRRYRRIDSCDRNLCQTCNHRYDSCL